MAPNGRAARTEGIVPRHSRRCATHTGRACDCRPRVQAQVYSPRDGRTIRKTFRTEAEARAWRADTQAGVGRGVMRASTRTTLAEAAEDWLAGVEASIVRTRSGDPYKPSAIRSYRSREKGAAKPRAHCRGGRGARS